MDTDIAGEFSSFFFFLSFPREPASHSAVEQKEAPWKTPPSPLSSLLFDFVEQAGGHQGGAGRGIGRLCLFLLSFSFFVRQKLKSGGRCSPAPCPFLVPPPFPLSCGAW